METFLIPFIAALIGAFVCLCVVINRTYVSGKPRKVMLLGYVVFFVLSLVFLSLSVVEKPGETRAAPAYYKEYYVNGIKVGRSGLMGGSEVIGRVTIGSELLVFALFFLVMGSLSALNLIYAKEKAKRNSGGIVRKIFSFMLYSYVGSLTLGIVPLLYLGKNKP